jgi:hypothetical protein
MTAKGSAFYIDTEGNAHAGGDGVKRGLQWLRDQGGSGLIVVDILNTLDDLPLGLTKPEISTLKTGGPVANGTRSLTALSKRKLETQWSGPVLVIYPSSDLLDKVDALKLVNSVLVVPWSKPEVQEWISRWSAQPLGAQGTVVPPAETVVTEVSPDDANVLSAALLELTNRVNLSTGLADLGDTATAIDLFVMLKQGGVNYSPEDVKSRLIRDHKWEPHHAEEVKVVAEKVLKGKPPKKHENYASSRWQDNSIERWRTTALSRKAPPS